MAKKQADYGNESITMLKGADKVRKRPGVIFGSDGLDGCEHSVFEVISNSIDEARAGFGDHIIVTRYQDQTIEVQDFGRGCPVDYNNTEKRYNWELVYCELYAGGKYDAEGDTYAYSLGLNGLGLCATQFASEFMDVEIFRDGFRYNLHFEHGNNVGGLKKEPTTQKKTGTRTRWKPDLDVFTDIRIPDEFFHDILRRQAIVNPNLLFTYRSQSEDGSFSAREFRYENGITDYVQEIVGDKAMTSIQHWQCEKKGRDRADKPEYKVRINVALTFSNQIKLTEFYHNSSFLEHGGSPEKATRLAFVGAIDKYLRDSNKYLKAEPKITYADVQDCLVLVSSNFSTQTSYENQTKKAITNKFIQDAMADFLRERLAVYFIENHDAAEKIASQVLINKRSRETAEKTRINQKKKLTEKIDIANRVQKFVDCRTKDAARRELYIVEGDSALGACKQSRDAEFQGLMPVRGKILNCLKADYPRIFKSEVITDLMKVLGCGVEVSGRAVKDLNQFDLANLRWSKVIICTDGDVDGFQIRTLILTMLYRLCPTLIREGFVYIAETPLFEITCKDKTWFAYSEREKADILRSLEGKKVNVQRSKGLGENDPEMMWMTTMSPETRRLVRVQSAEAAETARVFDLLLGDNLAGRKDYIAENGYKYMDMIDVS